MEHPVTANNRMYELYTVDCGDPAISLNSHHVSLVQLTTRLLPVMRDPGSIPQGGIYVKPEFSCQRCLATGEYRRYQIGLRPKVADR